ncbi:MAG: hypothetical protein IK121_04625 [Lachnospiraceae bacterium]|nr:hypothetical protein [Lachnospiraceae bacterium]
MNVTVYENKGDFYICIKNAPKGTKEALEKLVTDSTIKELKGLLKTEDPVEDIPGTAIEIGEFKDLPEGVEAPFERETLPFNKPTKEEKKKEEPKPEPDDDLDDLFQ